MRKGVKAVTKTGPVVSIT